MLSHPGVPPDAYLWLPLALTLVELLVALRVLHGAVGRAMRARGRSSARRSSAKARSPVSPE